MMIIIMKIIIIIIIIIIIMIIIIIAALEGDFISRTCERYKFEKNVDTFLDYIH